MEFNIGKLPFNEVRTFLFETDKEFQTPLSSKLNIDEYAFKLSHYSEFSYCNDESIIVGMISCYMNRPPNAYISNVCVRSHYQNQGIFKQMFNNLVDALKSRGFTTIRLEVSDDNVIAQKAYTNMGFIYSNRASDNSYYLSFSIK